MWETVNVLAGQNNSADTSQGGTQACRVASGQVPTMLLAAADPNVGHVAAPTIVDTPTGNAGGIMRLHCCHHPTAAVTQSHTTTVATAAVYVHVGVLDSPPRSSSPELPSQQQARRPGRHSTCGGSIESTPNTNWQQQQQPHHHLPALQHRTSASAVAAAMAAGGVGGHGLGPGSDAGSSFAGSPASSMGSITGLLLAAQQQQYQPHVGAQAAARGAHAAAVGQGDVRASYTMPTAAGGGPDLSAGPSQVLSVSAMSEVQLSGS